MALSTDLIADISTAAARSDDESRLPPNEVPTMQGVSAAGASVEYGSVQH